MLANDICVGVKYMLLLNKYRQMNENHFAGLRARVSLKSKICIDPVAAAVAMTIMVAKANATKSQQSSVYNQPY